MCVYVYTKEEAILNEWDMSLQEIPPTQGSSIEFLTVTSKKSDGKQMCSFSYYCLEVDLWRNIFLCEFRMWYLSIA